jgi:hypothetical protein
MSDHQYWYRVASSVIGVEAPWWGPFDSHYAMTKHAGIKTVMLTFEVEVRPKTMKGQIKRDDEMEL